ncbi:MAG TPA: glycosyltransferase family 2 protein [bacterium]|nr:MAG: Undecaprenyl-phosphate mannosyltransferase [Parcubacteria group bacterium ADurb.Bin192]HPN15457.1 glycosyltransferase family 2 protein [bacterium]
MRVIGVIPAYNEESRIKDVIQACLQYVDGLVVIDDGSKSRLLEDSKNSNVTVLRHEINRGQGAALRTGTKAAIKLGADVIIHLDADGQHDPADIPVMLKPILENQADVVLGSRFMGIDPTGMPLVRRWLLKAGRWFNALALGVPRSLTDPQSGLRALTSSAAQQINFRQDRKAHASEILRCVTRSGLRWVEVPIHVKYTADTLRKGNRTTDALTIVWQLFIGLFTK